jgi:diguanylate cyclase (GGDEF)-like protein/PAS domain S-box-containing protein
MDRNNDKSQTVVAVVDPETYRRAFYSSPDYVSISSLADGTYIDVNASYERFAGMPREQIIGRTSTEVGVWPTAEDRARLVEAVRKKGELQGFPSRLKSRNGEIRNVEISASVAEINGEEILVAILRDVTEKMHDEAELRQYREHLEVLVRHRTAALQETNAELTKSNDRLEQAHARLLESGKRIRYIALHDVLTGLPNRSLLHDRISQSITQADRESSMMAVLFIDLDNFKHINDSLGHMIGDELLRTAAGRIRQCVRKCDTVARLGGDEFVVCISRLDRSEYAGRLAAKIIASLEKPFIIKDQMLHAGASIGISVYPGDGNTVDTLMQMADTAMYHAKSRGKGNYQFFTSSLNAAAQQRLSIESQLRHALPHNEFVLHYQPQVDIANGRILSAEALIRWQYPGRGLVPPLEFIPVAEESGLILKVGEWVLREACAQLGKWRRAGHRHLGIAVNLSARQVLQPGFSDFVASLLDVNGLPPEALDLEITESVLMEPSEENVATLRRLTTMGVRFSIDDFGTGYSNLSYLKRFPIHALKIDRSFVRGIVDDSSDKAITNTIIAMAKHLNLTVIAEGVEALEQAEFLATQGCHMAQGYYYGRPMEAGSFAALLQAQSG